MQRRSQHYRGRWILFLLLVAVVTGGLTRGAWLPWFGHFTIQAGAPVKAQGVAVLAGDTTGGRILRGAELVKQGFAPRVYVSGPVEVYGRNEADLAIALAVSRGYPASYFERVLTNADSTREEAVHMWEYLQKAGVKRFLVVTSEFHTRRAGRIYGLVTRGEGEVHMVAAATPDYDPEAWWKTRRGQKTVFMEWTKTLANWFGI